MWFSQTSSLPTSEKILRSTSSNSIFRSTCRKFLVHPFIDTSTTDTDIVRQASIYNTMILNLWNMYLYAFSKLTQNILWVTFIFQLFYCLQAVKKHRKLRMRLFSPAELFKKSLFSTWTAKTFLHWCIGSHGWLDKSCRVHFSIHYWATSWEEGQPGLKTLKKYLRNPLLQFCHSHHSQQQWCEYFPDSISQDVNSFFITQACKAPGMLSSSLAALDVERLHEY